MKATFKTTLEGRTDGPIGIIIPLEVIEALGTGSKKITQLSSRISEKEQ